MRYRSARTVALAALLGAAALAGCSHKVELYCDEDTPCEDPELPFCDLTGEYPASEGIGHTCIPSPFDASVLDAAPGQDGGEDAKPLPDAASDNADLAELRHTAPANLSPEFDSSTTAYSMNVSLLVQAVQFTLVAANPASTLRLNNTEVVSGEPSDWVALEAGVNNVSIVVKAPAGNETTYTLLVNRSGTPVQYAYVKSEAPLSDGLFGSSLALSGQTLLIGQPEEDGTEPGEAALLARNETAWSHQEALEANNKEAEDLLGASVAISGARAYVGAYGEDSSASGIDGDSADNAAANSGAVFSFYWTGAIWAPEAYFKASNTDSGDHFGHAVAATEDTLVVGAPHEASNSTGVNGNQADDSAADSGAVYVFRRIGDIWSQEAYLKASNTESGDEFGHSVAISGDTLVVGARYEDSSATGINGTQTDNGATNCGAVYVFRRSGSSWFQEAYVKPSNTDATADSLGDEFGSSVAVDGDTLLVGARREDSGATGVNGNDGDDTEPSAGAAYVFHRSGSTWTQEAYIKATNASAGDLFGGSVAVRGELAVVGACGESSGATGVGGAQADNSASGAGAVYLFRNAGASWSQIAFVKASNTDAGDRFCQVVLGEDTLAVGASGEASTASGVNGSQLDDTGRDVGAVYVFH